MSTPADPLWDRWDDIDRLLERLLDVDAPQRESELTRLCEGDAALERTLRELLAASEEGGPVSTGPSSRIVSAAFEARAPADRLPSHLGPYRVIERLGRGGMGSVFLAERDDPTFPNRVALKVLRRGLDTDDVLARFRSERQILASLHHPGIAAVFDAGTTDGGRPFLVMEYVEGRPVTGHCDEQRLDVRERLRLFMAVLRAVSHAHGHGVVHRDLKPSNILVTDAEAHVKLLDFGIAKLLDRDDSPEPAPLTEPGTRPMTPGYASPEQFLARHITVASDIYQLGVLLHELLTGRRPFEDHAGRDYEERVTSTSPDPPSRVVRTMPPDLEMRGVADGHALARILAGDLDAIILHCLQPDPADRYRSVDDLHADVERYLDGLPVAARRATRIYRLEKAIRRRASAFAVLGVVLGTIAASWLVFGGASPPDIEFASIRDATAPIDGETDATRSRAYGFYAEGLAALGAGDTRVADRFFHAALEEDSAFALAAYYASRTTYDDQPHLGTQLLNRAYRLAEGAPDRDRLVIRSHWAYAMGDPSLGALADSLVQRFPAEPQGHYLLGRDLVQNGRFIDAVGHLERAVALDSLSLHSESVPCVACDALETLVRAHLLADSLPAAIRVGERWTRLQPGSARAWYWFAYGLGDASRPEEAIEAQARAATLRVGEPTDLLFPGMLALRMGDFDAADRLFRLHLRTGNPRLRIQAAHWLAISLRTQGRWDDALEASESLLEVARGRPEGDRLDILGHLARALALLGRGQADEAAELFEASARGYEEFTASRIARDRAWYLTHAGMARAAVRDTAALAELAERVEALGARSNYARDRRLHHYLRALLARARGAPEPEIERHLRAALFSLPKGHSRINLELAESLLRQRRYDEAAAIAAAALRNSMESNGMYATRTDFHELLGRIWHEAGATDRAAVHLRAALDAWQAADPIMRPRIERLERLLAEVRAPAS